MAAAAVFLAGPASSYPTGTTTITVDGGLMLTAAEENARYAGELVPAAGREEIA